MKKSEWKSQYSYVREAVRAAVNLRNENRTSQDEYLRGMAEIRERFPVAYVAVVCRRHVKWNVKGMIERKLSLREIKIAMWSNTRAGAMANIVVEWP